MISWFICAYKRRDALGEVQRYCAMNDFTPLIYGEGGAWTESEVLGNHAIVKVRASAGVLAQISDTPGFQRLPKDRLEASLADLSQPQKKAISDKIESLGYSKNELREALGSDLGVKTLRDVLKFIARRRLRPRYDSATDEIVLDGPEQPVRPIESVDEEIQ